MKNSFLNKVSGGLIVSCQALENEPLHSSFIMGRMARAADQNGAVGIRANTVEDIKEIRKETNLPIIAIIKREYPDSELYITATKKEVEELKEVNPEVIAIDFRNKKRPNGETIEELIEFARNILPNTLLMADCETEEEVYQAAKAGFDFAGTTFFGKNRELAKIVENDYELLKRLIKNSKIPIIAEGGVETPEEAADILKLEGLATLVVGSIITRPQYIIEKFVKKIKEN